MTTDYRYLETLAAPVGPCPSYPKGKSINQEKLLAYLNWRLQKLAQYHRNAMTGQKSLPSQFFDNEPNLETHFKKSKGYQIASIWQKIHWVDAKIAYFLHDALTQFYARYQEVETENKQLALEINQAKALLDEKTKEKDFPSLAEPKRIIDDIAPLNLSSSSNDSVETVKPATLLKRSVTFVRLPDGSPVTTPLTSPDGNQMKKRSFISLAWTGIKRFHERLTHKSPSLHNVETKISEACHALYMPMHHLILYPLFSNVLVPLWGIALFLLSPILYIISLTLPLWQQLDKWLVQCFNLDQTESSPVIESASTEVTTLFSRKNDLQDLKVSTASRMHQPSGLELNDTAMSTAAPLGSVKTVHTVSTPAIFEQKNPELLFLKPLERTSKSKSTPSLSKAVEEDANSESKPIPLKPKPVKPTLKRNTSFVLGESRAGDTPVRKSTPNLVL